MQKLSPTLAVSLSGSGAFVIFISLFLAFQDNPVVWQLGALLAFLGLISCIAGLVMSITTVSSGGSNKGVSITSIVISSMFIIIGFPVLIAGIAR